MSDAMIVPSIKRGAAAGILGPDLSHVFLEIYSKRSSPSTFVGQNIDGNGKQSTKVARSFDMPDSDYLRWFPAAADSHQENHTCRY